MDGVISLFGLEQDHSREVGHGPGVTAGVLTFDPSEVLIPKVVFVFFWFFCFFAFFGGGPGSFISWSSRVKTGGDELWPLGPLLFVLCLQPSSRSLL